MMGHRRFGCTCAWMLFPAGMVALLNFALVVESSNLHVPLLPRRALQQSGPKPDCGLAFQPCCSTEETCTDEALNCIAREGGPTCEPCGTAFAQPCPSAPYCSVAQLLPTTRRVDATVQCRPCGTEWQPCCGTVDSLCEDGLICYAEQDRCVAPEYVAIEEEFLPNGNVSGVAGICGGNTDPPCMETTVKGPEWRCEQGLALAVPVFLCLKTATVDRVSAPAEGDCGSELEVPCKSGCEAGFTNIYMQDTNESLCLASYSLLESGMQPPAGPAVPGRSVDSNRSDMEPVRNQSVQGGIQSKCGTMGFPACTADVPCECGLMNQGGTCVPDPAGCISETAAAVARPGTHSPQAAVLDQNACGKQGLAPCHSGTTMPCECGLVPSGDGTECEATFSPGPCPVRPFCGTAGQVTCATGQECNECLSPDEDDICTPTAGCLVFGQGEIEDQSGSTCGNDGALPCENKPYCLAGLLPTEAGICEPCGAQAGDVPCPEPPFCSDRLISSIGDVALDFCEPCGGVNQPPCGDRLVDQPCDEGLFRTSVSLVDNVRIRANGQESFCSQVDVDGRCGFVGQESCGGKCFGRSSASEDGLQCVECGGLGEGTCDGPNQEPCGPGLVPSQPSSDLALVCICPDTGCVESVVEMSTQSGIKPCGGLNFPQCTHGTPCERRLLPDEDGICTPCGSAAGQVPCPADDLPRCGKRLVLIGDFCAACGGANEPVCCDRVLCDPNDPTNTACDKGLFRTGIQALPETSLQVFGLDGFCSTEQIGNSCGLTRQPPCEGEGVTACLNLSTKSMSGTECVPCGKSGEPPCLDRFRMCTASLVVVLGDNDEPALCFAPSAAADAGVLTQSSEPCGDIEQPWCEGRGSLCVGKTVASGKTRTCIKCGGAGDPVCQDAPTFCDEGLRRDGFTCVACGGENQPVCALSRLGEPCNEGLEAIGGVCVLTV